MDHEIAINLLTAKLRDYASSRGKSVARGAETPRLAGLLIQKYGLGLADAVTEIYDSPRAADKLRALTDELVEQFDPNWRINAKKRWEATPADIWV